MAGMRKTISTGSRDDVETDGRPGRSDGVRGILTGPKMIAGSGAKTTSHSIVNYFFFQAEDGIRDLTVTGVQTCTLPISLPGCAHHVRIFRASQAAVVAPQRAEVIAVFDVEIVPENRAAVRDIGAQVEQVMARLPDLIQPERHHLHVATRPGLRYRVLAKLALDLDQAEHQLRIEPRAGGLVMHRAQQLQALPAVGDARGYALFHLVQPALRILRRAEMQVRRSAIRDLGRQARAHAVGKRLVDLRPGKRGHGQQQAKESRDPPHARRRSFRKLPIESSGISRGFSSRRPLYSAFPAASPRSDSTTRCGMPIRSMSANSTPGRSSRSSISTSIPACSSASCMRSAASRTAGLF